MRKGKAKTLRRQLLAGNFRLWIENFPDDVCKRPANEDDRIQIVVCAADYAKKPPHGDVSPFHVTDLLTGESHWLRRADCGLGCQCALEFVDVTAVRQDAGESNLAGQESSHWLLPGVARRLQ